VGYSPAFQEPTAKVDRLLFAVIVQSHHALAKCSNLLTLIESSPVEGYSSNTELTQRNSKRLLRATFHLRSIVEIIFKGRNELLRVALSTSAYDALEVGLKKMTPKNRPVNGGETENANANDASLRAFLFFANSWVRRFNGCWTPKAKAKYDMDASEQGQNAQGNPYHDFPDHQAHDIAYSYGSDSSRGLLVIEELASESFFIVDEYNRALDSPFEHYREDQRPWMETSDIICLENEGDRSLKRLSQGYRNGLNETKRLESSRAISATRGWDIIEYKISSIWSFWDHGDDSFKFHGESTCRHWKLPEHPDRLHRRILLIPNSSFDSHISASYPGQRLDMMEKSVSRRRFSRRVSTDILSKASMAFYKNPSEVEDNELSRIEEDGDSKAKLFNENFPKDQSPAEDIGDAMDIGLDNPDKTGLEDDDCDERDKNGWEKSFAWCSGERVVERFDSVVLVSLRSSTEGQLLLTTHSLYFHPTGDDINDVTKKKITRSGEGRICNRKGDSRWRLSRLTEVHGRRYMLRAQALELCFADAFELFINFYDGAKIRNHFYSKLRSVCKVPMLHSPRSLNPKSVYNVSTVTDLWCKRQISNFEYIMQLNIMAGRTFNDIRQYPVFPWILSDYTSETLNLNDPHVFRDLSKPVGALNSDRLAKLIERYNDLDDCEEHEKFLYGSHYSSPGIVLHYLIRQEPFTTMAIDLQSGRFDCADRIFSNIGDCWHNCLHGSADVKELIPEFFTCPEMFLNSNKFNLGINQEKNAVDDVVLPPWAKDSVHEFVRLHRLALESEYVSQNLHHWIDLIFGHKQRGPEAVEAHNVFHFLSYEGSVELDAIKDDIEREATESRIQNFGQTPSQLLLKEHPSRFLAEDCWRPFCSEIFPLRQVRCWTPHKQFGGSFSPESGGSNTSKAHGAVLSIHISTDQIIAIYADLNVGTFRWSNLPGGDTPFFFKTDKLRPLDTRVVSMSATAILTSSIHNNVSTMDRISELSSLMGGCDQSIPTGSKIFGFTIGGSRKESANRKAATTRMGLTNKRPSVRPLPTRTMPKKGLAGLSTRNLNAISSRTLEVTLRPDITPFLLSCGYWDGTIKVHSTDSLSLKCSATGGHRGPITCISIGDDGGR